MDPRARTLLTMHMTLNPSDDVDILYVSRKERRRGLTSILGSNAVSIQRLDHIRKRRGRLITATRSNTNNTSINSTKMDRKQKCDEILLYGHFK